MISERTIVITMRWMLGLMALVPIGMLIAGGYLGMPWWMTVAFLLMAADILSTAVFNFPIFRMGPIGKWLYGVTEDQNEGLI